jgi:hypothetical protein
MIHRRSLWLDWGSFDNNGPHHINVSSTEDGGKIPARLFGIELVKMLDGTPVRKSTAKPDSIAMKVLEDMGILDTGSAIGLAGERAAKKWLQEGYARKTEPLPRSIRAVRGIGALNKVTMWITVTLNIGGVFVTIDDLPVIGQHNGLLLGNDFLGKGRARIDYDSQYGGSLTIRDETLKPISSRVFFRTVRGDNDDEGLNALAALASRKRLKRRVVKVQRQETTAYESEYESDSETTGAAYNAASFGEITEEERAQKVAQQRDAAEVENELKEIAPIGWTPETVEVPGWSEKFFKVRLPATLVKARDVLLLPLEDERREDIGVLIAPTLEKVTKDGYAYCRAINMSDKKVRIPLLTPVVRFQVDPRVYNIEHEHTAEEIMEKIQLADDLTAEERNSVLNLIKARRALFRSKLGHAHGYKMSIKVEPGSKKPNAQLRVRSDEEEAAMNEEVTKQWKAGLIEPCRSPYGALPMLVKKPTKEGQPQQYRMVLDYRGVNQILEKDVYRLPNLATNLSRLGKANWFTTCDLLQGFHQVEIEDDGSKEITAFNTPMGQFQYVRMPMGLASSPSTFMRIVDATLRGLPPGIALAYCDDICIPTCGTFEEHMRDVGMVFDRLIEAGFTVRCDKCHIGLKEVPYLGFMVGAYGTRPLPEKTQAILDIALDDMRNNPAVASRFAGMMGFYSRFIPDLQGALAAFHDLKGKAAPVAHIVGDENTTSSLRFMASFTLARHQLANITALARPDSSKTYYIYVDAASSCGLGAVLMQRDDPDDPESLRPIEFWSRRLTDEERGYGVRDQECLGLSDALRQWRHYLLGGKVEVMSDHASLQWLLSTAHPDGSRVSGWALNAQNYNIKINYIPGSQQVVADFFSRSAKRDQQVLEQSTAGRRELVEDRLDEAVLTTDTVTPLAMLSEGGIDLHLGKWAADKSIQQPRWNRWSNGKEQHSQSTDSEASDTETVLSYAAHTYGKEAERAALAVLHETSEGTQMLVEQVAGVVACPSIGVDRCAKFSYRDQLLSSLQHVAGGHAQAVAKHAQAFRKRGQLAVSQYFLSFVDDAVASSLTASSEFQFININMLDQLTEREDREFIRLTARELTLTGVDVTTARSKWIGSFKKVGTARPEAAVPVMQLDTTPLPTPADKPNGPAFCGTVAHGRFAIDGIYARLRRHPGLSMSVDAEGLLGGRRGHIDLLQISVDAVEEDEQQLIYVLDTHILGSKFLSGPLRELLEDGGVPKVLHCSYGDAGTLFTEYDIRMQGVFDTGVADCVLRRVGLNRQRKLDTVIDSFLEGAAMTHKSTFKHIPHMFATRPLPKEYFEYAYEDVIHCNRLYKAMKTRLQEHGLFELVLRLSALRSPPLALHPDHPLYEHATRLTVVVHDNEKVICLQDLATGTVTVPSIKHDHKADQRGEAHRAWVQCMGTELTGAVANRMRKAVRLGDALVVDVSVPDCTALLGRLRQSQQLMGERLGECSVVARNLSGPKTDSQEAGSTPENDADQVIFQYFDWQTSTRYNNHQAESKVVVGRTQEKTRVAIAVYDDDHVYCLTTPKKGALQFPSHPLEVGAEETHMAEKAFDLFAGTAMRKGGAEVLGITTARMPATAAALHSAFQNIQRIVKSGNTVYYGCYVPNLAQYRSSFHAARQQVNGFRLVKTLKDRHPGFTVCTWEEAARTLDPSNDIAVVQAFRDRTTDAAVRVPRGVSQVPESQLPHSQAATYTAKPVSVRQADALLMELMSDAQHSGYASAYEIEAEEEVPEHGQDAEYDAMFEAAVLVHYSAYLEERGTETEAEAESFVGSIGMKPEEAPTIEMIRGEQRGHPATGRMVDYLLHGELSPQYQTMCEQDREELSKRAAEFRIDDNGLLCTQARVGKSQHDVVVIPPRFRPYYLRQFHDKSGHLGVDKVNSMLKERYHWGGNDGLRKDVSEHIKRCGPCQQSKMPTHPAGEYQIGYCGEHPGDIWCGDVYHTGFEEDGYDQTLDFACFFSRRIRSIPIQGDPDSETVVDYLINHIIRNSGVPSEVRTDAAANLISAGIQLLYKRMGIKITIGTAYHHQLVALVERWHRTLSQLIRVHQAARKSSGELRGWGSRWYRCIPLMELVYNNTINPRTKYSPFFLEHMRHARLPYDNLRVKPPELPKNLPEWVQDRLDDLNVTYDAAARELRLNAITAKRRYDLKHDVQLWYKPGDRVLLIKGSVTDKKAIHPKAVTPTDGPFTIAKALTNDRYLLTDLKTRRIRDSVHVSRLLPYFESLPEDKPNWMLKVAPENGSWPIYGITGRRVQVVQQADKELGLEKGAEVLEYKVRWLGYDRTWDTWRPVQSLSTIMELIKEYDRSNPRPSELLEAELEIVQRPEGELQVEPEAAALEKRHMRAHPHQGRRPGEKKSDTKEDEIIPIATCEEPAPQELSEREQRRINRIRRQLA